MLTVTALDHLVLSVRDVEASAAWYGRVLGMARRVARPVEGGAPRTSMVFGPNKINLRPVEAGQEAWFTGLAPCAGSADLCFLTTASPEEVVAHVQGCGVAVVEGPVIKQGARGPIRSVYLRDPDGNLIEVSSAL